MALPDDDDGADPAGLAEGVGMVLLTPAHQHPIGVALTPGRRSEFAEWATRSGGYLVEDDYDGEFRYDRRPVGALQSLAPDRVVYSGSTSKSLAPGMRLGWLVVPPALRRPLLETIETSGAAVPVIDQLAFTDLLEHGHYDRHVRSIRAVQGRRRAELAQRLSGTGPAHLMGELAGVARLAAGRLGRA